MSMTREEIIKSYEDAVVASGLAAAARNEEAAKSYELFKAGLSALLPVSREQVEKVWRGEWEDMRESYNDVPKRRCSRCKSVFIGLDTPFCEVCGAPMTDEAVDMVVERLEALKVE